tara:strand:- start:816 stop:1265 length:450 start_codon:yes stop_codon:yes gene_type:complete
MDKMTEKKGNFKTAGQNLKEGLKEGWDKYKSGDISYTIPSLVKKLWGKEAQNKRQGVRTAVLKDLHPKPKPKNVKNLSSKFKRKPSGEQEKVSAPERLKEIKREDAWKNIKNIVQGKKYGGRTKPYGMKHGGVCKGMGKATQGGKFTVS